MNLYHNGTEVIVNLSPNTVVQVKINDAEFIVKGKEILSVQKPRKLYMADKLIMDEYMEFEESLKFEQINIPKFSEQELFQETVKFEGIINTDNISPPPYDNRDDIFEITDEPPKYFASYLPPPEYTINRKIKKKVLSKFKTRFFLPNYIEARMETGLSEDEYNKLFWGQVGEDGYDPLLCGSEESWNRLQRQYGDTEYYNRESNLAEQDSVLRENYDIYTPQEPQYRDDEIIQVPQFTNDEIISGFCPCRRC